MYQNCWYSSEKTPIAKNGTIFLWDDEHGFLKFPYQQYAYRKDNSGSFTALTGTRLKKVSNWTLDDVKDGIMYESDVDAVMRTLIDRYSDSDNLSINHRKWVIDIEVSMVGGASEPAIAANEITSISLRELQTEKRIVIILDKNELVRSRQYGDTRIISAQSELTLINKFLSIWSEIKPTIVTGWNVVEYDIPYLYNRIKNVIGKRAANQLSPVGLISERPGNNGRPTFRLAGISVLDYMVLYKEFTYNEETSYSLDAISYKELMRGKIEYDGSLDDLYKEDIDKFIRYNLEDCNLVNDIDSKLDFINLAMTICHKGHVPYEDIIYTSRFLEGAALTFMKRAGVVSPNRKSKIKLIAGRHHHRGEYVLEMDAPIPDEIPRRGRLKVFKTETSVIDVEYNDVRGNQFILPNPLSDTVDQTMNIKLNLLGAYVKEPIPGRYEWLYDLDLKSLYPSIIMTLNISPETKVGKILNWSDAEFRQATEKEYIFYSRGKKTKMSHCDLKNFLSENKYSISASGTMYRTDVVGFIPTILEKWFDERDEYKNLMKEYKKKGDKQKANFYNLRQLAQKVMLNAFYGVMALQSFRYYDIDNAESVTSTGQNIIKYSSSMLNYYYNSILGTQSIDYVTYTDTDSIFASALPIIRLQYKNIDENNNELMSNATLEIVNDVQKFINDAYNIYVSNMHNVKEHKLYIKQELIGKAGFWNAKKRYAIWVINKEGVPIIDKNTGEIGELEIKGLDVVRSDFPIAFRGLMSDVLWDILKNAPKEKVDERILTFKETLRSRNLIDTLNPSGIHNLDKFDVEERDAFETIKGTTAHAKAVLNHNDLIKLLNETSCEPIKNGDKIKWAYLKKNQYMMESCAMKGYKDSQKIIDFIKEYIDYEKMFDNKVGKKLGDFYNAMSWDSLPRNSKVTEFFSF